MTPPDFLTIGYRTMALRFVPGDAIPGNDGQFDRAGSQILICAELSRQEQAETAIHEVLHGCWPPFDIPPGADTEEMVVTHAASILAQTLRDNPEFWAWASDALRVKSVLKPLTRGRQTAAITRGPRF